MAPRKSTNTLMFPSLMLASMLFFYFYPNIIHINHVKRTAFDIFIKNDAVKKELIKIADDITLYETPPRITSEQLEKALPDLKARVLAFNEGTCIHIRESFLYSHLKYSEQSSKDGKQEDVKQELIKQEAPAAKQGEDKSNETENPALIKEAITDLTQFVETQFALLLELAESIFYIL